MATAIPIDPTRIMQKINEIGAGVGLDEGQINESLLRISELFVRVAPGVADGESPDPARLLSGLQRVLQDTPMLVAWGLRIAATAAEPVWRRFADDFLLGLVQGRQQTLAEGRAALGHAPPVTLVINPTMRCNLRCTGCYAYTFDRTADMDPALLFDTLEQARELGIRFITVTGGEPFLYPQLLAMYERFPELIFMTYTSGQTLDAATVERLTALGNVWPAVSVEGFEQETDARRGAGVHAEIRAAMERMRRAGMIFGFSATPTRHNTDVLASDRFVDEYLGRGAAFGWMFTYMPVGRKPDPSLMQTPEQRDQLRKKALHWRDTRPLFLADFWNDGPLCGGCLSASRYAYVTPDGWVQPCTFVHFATHNLREHRLAEIFDSPLFRAIRARQPYDTNLLRPCKIIDHPEVLREVVAETGARPTCPGAEAIVADPELRAFLDRYSREYGALAEQAWAGPEYRSGHSVRVPFFGRRDLYEIFGDRMQAARRQDERRAAAESVGAPLRAAAGQGR